jgi:hypothetical protein
VHFEDTNLHLLPSGGATSAPTIVTFPTSVGPFAYSADGTTAFAARVNPSAGTVGSYSLMQDFVGVTNGSILPVGQPYDTSIPPSPASSPMPTPTPNAKQVIANVTGASVIGAGMLGVGVVVGPNSTGVLGLASLSAAPPVFGGFVPYSNGTVSPPAGTQFYNVEVSSDDLTVLLRGPTAAESFTITFPSGTFQFTNPIVNTTLGSMSGPILGRGGMAINPGLSTTAVMIQTPTLNSVQTVKGLPGMFTIGTPVTLGSTPRSVAIAFPSNGVASNIAVVGGDDGFYIVQGASSGVLVVQAPYLTPGADGQANSPTYTGCDGKPHQLQNVTSIGISADNRYVAALGHPTGSTCASLVAVPLVASSSTPSPSPTPSGSTVTAPPSMFVQNNLPVPSPGVDYMRVR